MKPFTSMAAATALAVTPVGYAEDEVPELARIVAESRGYDASQIVLMDDGSSMVRDGFSLKPLLTGCHTPGQRPPRELRTAEKPPCRDEELPDEDLDLDDLDV